VIIRTNGEPPHRDPCVAGDAAAAGAAGGAAEHDAFGGGPLRGARGERGWPRHSVEGGGLLLLSEAARTGSVPAMKEVTCYHERQRGTWRPLDALDHFDQLAARRRYQDR
jgi:hypothetical protein